MTATLPASEASEDADTGVDIGASGREAAPADVADAQPDGYPHLIRDVDPLELVLEGNVRDVGDVRQTHPRLYESIAEHGLDPAVSVIHAERDAEGVLRVTVGFHRAAAAVALRRDEQPDLRVPVLVNAPGTHQNRLIRQGVENLNRKDFTCNDKSVLYQQLSLEGLTDEDIALALSLPDGAEVRAGRAVAASPRTAATSDQMPEVDLFTLASLAEFEDDPGRHHELSQVLVRNPAQFDSTIIRARRARAQAQVQVAEERRWIEAGYTLIGEYVDQEDAAVELSELCAPDGSERPMDSAEHAACPGRAVDIWASSDGQSEVTEYCLDPHGQQHRTLAAVYREAKERELRKQGVRVVDADSHDGTYVRHLYVSEADQTILSPESHAGCPGHAAYVDTGPISPVPLVRHVCLDPDQYGHVTWCVSSTGRGITPEPAPDPAYVSGQRKRTIHNNRAWHEEIGNRREWLRKYFAGWRTAGRNATKNAKNTKTKNGGATKSSEPGQENLPARIESWLALAPVLAYDRLAEAAPSHAYACSLLGLADPVGTGPDGHPITLQLNKKTTNEAQALRIRLAQVLGAFESYWDRGYAATADHTWRNPDRSSRFYFQLLDALGYSPSLVERLVTDPQADAEHWPHLAATDDLATTSDADGAPTDDPEAHAGANGPDGEGTTGLVTSDVDSGGNAEGAPPEDGPLVDEPGEAVTAVGAAA